MDKYSLAYLDMCIRFAQTSTAKRLKVGCILVKDNTIVSEGVNGTYKGCYTNDCEGPDGLTTGNVVHAEANCIDKAARLGRATQGSTAFISHSPCVSCSQRLIGAGIVKVVYKELYRCDKGLSLLQQAGIEVIKVD